MREKPGITQIPEFLENEKSLANNVAETQKIYITMNNGAFKIFDSICALGGGIWMTKLSSKRGLIEFSTSSFIEFWWNLARRWVPWQIEVYELLKQLSHQHGYGSDKRYRKANSSTWYCSSDSIFIKYRMFLTSEEYGHLPIFEPMCLSSRNGVNRYFENAL